MSNPFRRGPFCGPRAVAAVDVSSLARQASKQLKKDAYDAFKPSHELMKKIRDAIEDDPQAWRGDEDAEDFLAAFREWPNTLLSSTDDIRDEDLEEALAGLSVKRLRPATPLAKTTKKK